MLRQRTDDRKIFDQKPARAVRLPLSLYGRVYALPPREIYHWNPQPQIERFAIPEETGEITHVQAPDQEGGSPSNPEVEVGSPD